MATSYSVRILGISQAADGTVHIRIRETVDGNVNDTERVYGSGQAVQDDVDGFIDRVINADICHAMLLAWWKRRNPTLNNPSLVTSKTLTFDLASNQIVSVT